MSDFVAFLRARLDEDEHVARAAPSSCDVFDGTGCIVMHASTGTRSVTLPSHVARFTARFDPARVLAEVDAKRRILERAVAEIESQDPPRASAIFASGVLLLLAVPYADHPAFREEWRP